MYENAFLLTLLFFIFVLTSSSILVLIALIRRPINSSGETAWESYMPVLTTPQGYDMWGDSQEAKKLRKAAEDTITQIIENPFGGVILPHGWELKVVGIGRRR